jgi:hypothetical protein
MRPVARSTLRVFPASPFPISDLSGFQGRLFFPPDNSSSVTEFSAHHAKIADDDEIMIWVLKNDSHRAGGNALAAIRTLDLVHNIGTGICAADGSLRTDLGAFTALRADIRTVFPRVWKFGFDTKGGLLRVDLTEMLDAADLEAKSATCAFVPVDFYSHD